MRDGGAWVAEREAAEARLPEVLQRPEARDGWRAWLHAAPAARCRRRCRRTSCRAVRGESVALLRLVLIGGTDAAGYNALVEGPLRAVSLAGHVAQALLDLCRWKLLERVDRTLLWRLLAALESTTLLRQAPAMLRWADEHLADAPADGLFGLRLRLAELRLQRGDADGTRAALDGDATAAMARPLFDALLPARFGRFVETVAAYPPAAKALGAKVGKRRGFAPQAVLQWYVLALMAQPDAGGVDGGAQVLRRRVGRRASPPPHDDWGRWAHAAGDAPGRRARRPGRVRQPGRRVRTGSCATADRHRRPRRSSPPGSATARARLGRAAAAGAVRRAARRLGRRWKADLLAPGLRPARLAAAVAAGRRAAALARRLSSARARTPGARRWRRSPRSATSARRHRRQAAGDAAVATDAWTPRAASHDLQALRALRPASRGKPQAGDARCKLKKRTRLDPRDAAVARCHARSGATTRNDAAASTSRRRVHRAA
ncbi:MAG: hypothetical protein MZW92_66885 [Comamonadaceae bacterium]|nr:hypothetical protein [Comamonadaceae bacterium]